MPMPSKFTAKRLELVLVALAAGASRRTAAQVAGIDHSTLGGWLRRGSKASEGSRFRAFRDEVLRAEADPHRPRLLPRDEPPPISATWYAGILDAEFAPAPTGAITVSVSFHDGSPT